MSVFSKKNSSFFDDDDSAKFCCCAIFGPHQPTKAVAQVDFCHAQPNFSTLVTAGLQKLLYHMVLGSDCVIFSQIFYQDTLVSSMAHTHTETHESLLLFPSLIRLDWKISLNKQKCTRMPIEKLVFNNYFKSFSRS